MALEKTVIPDPAVDSALDARVLAELANMQRDGRSGFMDRLITLYLKTASELIAELKAASATDQPAVLHRVSHALKPCSATVGALALAALCERLEQTARSGSVPDLAVWVAAIVEEHKRVEAALPGPLEL